MKFGHVAFQLVCPCFDIMTTKPLWCTRRRFGRGLVVVCALGWYPCVKLLFMRGVSQDCFAKHKYVTCIYLHM